MGGCLLVKGGTCHSEEGCWDTWSRPSRLLRRLDALAGKLAEEMASAWRGGQRLQTEDLLTRHPELGSHSEAAARLIYEEICLRQEVGEEVSSVEILPRFPRWEKELAFLLKCHFLLQPEVTAPTFPERGETLGDFHLIAELGHGTLVVFSWQPNPLADRPVVLKLTPCDGQEHLSLARLQHTHIVPLYAVHDFSARNLGACACPTLAGRRSLVSWIKSGAGLSNGGSVWI